MNTAKYILISMGEILQAMFMLIFEPAIWILGGLLYLAFLGMMELHMFVASSVTAQYVSAGLIALFLVVVLINFLIRDWQ